MAKDNAPVKMPSRVCSKKTSGAHTVSVFEQTIRSVLPQIPFRIPLKIFPLYFSGGAKYLRCELHTALASSFSSNIKRSGKKAPLSRAHILAQ